MGVWVVTCEHSSKGFTLMVSRGWPATTLAIPGDESKVLCTPEPFVAGRDAVGLEERRDFHRNSCKGLSQGTSRRPLPDNSQKLSLNTFLCTLSWAPLALHLKGTREGEVMFVYLVQDQPLLHSCKLTQIFILRMVRFLFSTRQCFLLAQSDVLAGC